MHSATNNAKPQHKFSLKYFFNPTFHPRDTKTSPESRELLFNNVIILSLIYQNIPQNNRNVNCIAEENVKKYFNGNKSSLPLSTFVIDNPRRGDRITRKHSDELKYFLKLRVSLSSEELLIAAAFLSISDERQDVDDELFESRRSFLKQMQLRNISFLLNF